VNQGRPWRASRAASARFFKPKARSFSSIIEDTDFAVATARLNQQQVLIQSSVALLGVANQQAGQILSLL